jgi:hypothetical protein
MKQITPGGKFEGRSGAGLGQVRILLQSPQRGSVDAFSSSRAKGAASSKLWQVLKMERLSNRDERGGCYSMLRTLALFALSTRIYLLDHCLRRADVGTFLPSTCPSIAPVLPCSSSTGEGPYLSCPFMRLE